MGSGLSTSGVVLSNEKKPVENREHLRAVSKFLTKAYNRCSRAEAVVFLVTNDAGLKHFSNFVANQRETGYLDMYLELKGVQTTTNPSVLYFQQLLRRIVEEYINADSHRYIHIPSHLIQGIEDVLSQDFNKPITHIMDIIEQLSTEMVELMARNQFPRFLESKFYQNWQANDRGLTTASAKATLDSILKDHNGAQTNSTRSVHECSLVEDTTLLDRALVKSTSLETILRDGSWLSTLISAVELLPISFLLCQVAMKEQGEIPRFPVIFANKYVEKSFGFQRKALIGKPYDALLRCAETEKEDGSAAAELEAMAQQYQAASAVVTHANSTGVPFKNLVATKPIFDHSGTCVYVIYLMFTLSVCSCSSKSSSTSTCSGTEAANSPRGNKDSANPAVIATLDHNNAISNSIALQNSAASIRAAQQNTECDRFAYERTKAEKLLRILPKYVNLIKEEATPAPPAPASGMLKGTIGQLLPRFFNNRVQPNPANGGGEHRPQHVHGQAQVLSIREAKLSKGPDGRLGAAVS